MKRVLILTDEEIDLLLSWNLIGAGDDEEDSDLATKLRAAKLPA